MYTLTIGKAGCPPEHTIETPSLATAEAFVKALYDREKVQKIRLGYSLSPGYRWFWSATAKEFQTITDTMEF